LDDPLSRFRLSVAIPNGDHITVRQVCQMRSGPFEAYDTPQFDRLAGEVPAGFNARQLVAPTICSG
jgi:hypothetical protein